jgi:Circadian oscillating protein COP23
LAKKLGGYSKQERCHIITQRFQEAYSKGSLAYMTDGFMNGQKVICGTSSQGGSCEKLLLTLRPEDNAKDMI